MRASSTRRAGDVVLAEHLDHPLRRAVARRARTTTRQPSAEPPLDVGDRPVDVAAVGLGGLRGQGPGRARRRRARPGRRGPRRAGVVVEAERADRPPGLVRREACARGRRRASGRTRRPRSIGAVAAAGGRGPARAEELLAGGDQVVRRGCGPARGRAPARGCRPGIRSTQQLHVVDQHRGQRLHALDGDAVGDLVGAARPAAGARSPSSAARARTSSVSSSSRHGGAHSRLDRSRGCAGRRPRRSGSPRRRRPRTPPAAGAPRSAGRRRRCRRGPRTRRASRPGRPGSTPRRPGRRTTSSRSARAAPAPARPGSRSPSPLTCGWSTERTGATTTWTGPLAGVVAGVRAAGAAPRAAGRRCRCAGLSRSCGSVSQAG